MPPTRSAAFSAARAHLQTSLSTLDQQLADLDAAQAEDSKSSAGDKFETSREMLAQQIEQLDAHRTTVAKQLVALEMAQRVEASERTTLGSLVTTPDGKHCLIAVGLGKVKLPEGEIVWVISPESPMGRQLMGGK